MAFSVARVTHRIVAGDSSDSPFKSAPNEAKYRYITLYLNAVIFLSCSGWNSSINAAAANLGSCGEPCGGRKKKKISSGSGPSAESAAFITDISEFYKPDVPLLQKNPTQQLSKELPNAAAGGHLSAEL